MSLVLLIALGSTFTLAAVLISGASPIPAATFSRVVEAQQEVLGATCQRVEEDVEFHTPEHQTLQVLSDLTDPGSCCAACKAHPDCNVWMYASHEASRWNGMANVAGHCFFKRLNFGDRLIRVPRRGLTGGWFAREPWLQKLHTLAQKQQPQQQQQQQEDRQQQLPLSQHNGLRRAAIPTNLLTFAVTALQRHVEMKAADATSHSTAKNEVKPWREDGLEAKVKIGLPVHKQRLPNSGGKDSRSPVEVSEDNSVWEVVAPSAPVILKPGIPQSNFIGHKQYGQILVGSRVGSMVKLTHDFGFVPIGKPDGGNYLHERTLSYRIVHKGTCANAGFSPIRDPTLCAAATFALGYFDRHVTQYTGKLHRPEGCYLHGGLVWMSMSEENKGRGVEALSFPICSQLKPQATVVLD